ncbi:MAG: glycosyltransferase family 4 protein [Halobacteriaceae archaeon]
MHVAFVSATTRHHPGGAHDRAARIEGVARGLAGRGHDITVLTTRWWDADTETVTRDEVRYRAVADTPGIGFTLRVPWVLREVAPAVTHVVHDDPAVVVAAEFGNAPVVVDWYDLPGDRDGSVSRWMRRRAARGPGMVVTPSRLVQTSVRELGRPAEGIEVVPTGIEYDLIESVPPTDRGEIVYSRRLDADANLEDLLLALAEFRAFDWRAVVIGDGPRRDAYETQARDLRIDDRVEFTGDLPLEERLAAFKGAHAYVHTARRSSFPTDLVRALACGCIGIVSYHEQSSAHEFVEAKERGFLTTSPEEIADAIQTVGQLSHRTVDEEYASYGQDAVLDRYRDIYATLRSAW